MERARTLVQERERRKEAKDELLEQLLSELKTVSKDVSDLKLSADLQTRGMDAIKRAVHHRGGVQ